MAWADDTVLGTISSSAGASNISLTTGAASAAGVWVLAAVSWWQASSSITSMTVDGNAATIIQQQQNSAQGVALCAYYSTTVLASGITVVANFSTSVTFRGLGVASFTGGDPAATAEGAASATGSGGTRSTNVTTTSDDARIFEAAVHNNTTDNFPTSPTVEIIDLATLGGERLILSRRDTTTAGTYAIGGNAGVVIWSSAAAGLAVDPGLPTQSFRPDADTDAGGWTEV